MQIEFFPAGSEIRQHTGDVEHQVCQARQGQAPDDYIDPKELGSVTRQGVKAAFRVIDAVQRTMALEFDLHRA